MTQNTFLASIRIFCFNSVKNDTKHFSRFHTYFLFQFSKKVTKKHITVNTNYAQHSQKEGPNKMSPNI